jgi:Subtilase family
MLRWEESQRQQRTASGEGQLCRSRVSLGSLPGSPASKNPDIARGQPGRVPFHFPLREPPHLFGPQEFARTPGLVPQGPSSRRPLIRPHSQPTNVRRLSKSLRFGCTPVAAQRDREARRRSAASRDSAPLKNPSAVGATDATGDKWKIADFSNGRALVVAPGVGGGWATMSGTSMATPHVAGVAALWVEKLPTAGSLGLPDAVRSALRTSTTKHPLVDSDPDAIGAGLIQAPSN